MINNAYVFTQAKEVGVVSILSCVYVTQGKVVAFCVCCQICKHSVLVIPDAYHTPPLCTGAAPTLYWVPWRTARMFVHARWCDTTDVCMPHSTTLGKPQHQCHTECREGREHTHTHTHTNTHHYLLKLQHQRHTECREGREQHTRTNTHHNLLKTQHQRHTECREGRKHRGAVSSAAGGSQSCCWRVIQVGQGRKDKKRKIYAGSKTLPASIK